MTNDLSVGLFNEGVNDIYHSAFGALSEAYEKFVLPLDIKSLLKNKTEINVLDICYGIGYNTKAFLNEIIKYKLNNKLIKIDCVDNNETLILMSPFISSKISFIKKFKYKKYLKNNIESYSEANKILNSNKICPCRYKISKTIPKIIIKNLTKKYGTEFLSKEAKKIISEYKNHAFFDDNMLGFYKNLLYSEVELHQNKNKSAFVHNIYYKNISKRFINNLNNIKIDNILLNFFPCDIRTHLKMQLSDKYDVVFLDGFTPAKCPCIWSVDFFKALYSVMTTDSLIVTYNTSASVRNAMKLAGFNIGDTFYNKKIVGTTASKNISYIKHNLSDKNLGLLNTKAGIPYRDENLSLDNDTIILNRENEIASSNLISSSKYLKKWEKLYEK